MKEKTICIVQIMECEKASDKMSQTQDWERDYLTYHKTNP